MLHVRLVGSVLGNRVQGTSVRRTFRFPSLGIGYRGHGRFAQEGGLYVLKVNFGSLWPKVGVHRIFP